jgi:hypothetical protein
MTHVVSPTPDAEQSLNDLLEGAEAISAFLYGTPQRAQKIYHMSRTSRLPTFKLGGILCARKSIILEWISEQEHRSVKGAA